MTMKSSNCTEFKKKKCIDTTVYAATNNYDLKIRLYIYTFRNLGKAANKLSPAFAGIVQGVVVQMAKQTSGIYSSNKPPEVGDAHTNLKVA